MEKNPEVVGPLRPGLLNIVSFSPDKTGRGPVWLTGTPGEYDIPLIRRTLLMGIE